MTTRICVAIRSFEKYPLGLLPCTRRIQLPNTRVLYTVLRSPHIDKKSREQFHMITKKLLLVIDAKANELQKKFFWLKRQRILGAQYEIIFNSKTRLDKGKLQTLVNKETDTTPAAELGLKSIISG
ncbi:putative ribosomal protein S10 [Rosa chinensis]|uniref:Putative ribosomal protein S10 n=1 Tax=Rosa chinensis TaxID=74649 RepID=A0A2P6RZU1_ROSCH|nr:putative ribosomal protein S10 [Rosa chinensis]